MSRLIILILLIGALSIQAMANQAAYVQATKAEYTFADSNPDSQGNGEILVQIEQSSSKQFSKLRVGAFGKTFDLSKAQLSELDNYTCSGLIVMRGYDEEMESQVIYLRFSMAVFEQAGPPVVVIISQNGEMKIRKTKNTKPNKSVEETVSR